MHKKGVNIKYPRMLLTLSTFVIAYVLIYAKDFAPLHSFFISLGYLGFFIAGLFYPYGFTSAPATVMLILLANSNGILIPGLIAGLGSLIGDLFIFKFFRYSLNSEVEMLSKEKAITWINSRIPAKIKEYVFPALACFIIASPLPDEIGIFMLSAQRTISTKVFMAMSYVLNTAGILVILWAASVL